MTTRIPFDEARFNRLCDTAGILHRLILRWQANLLAADIAEDDAAVARWEAGLVRAKAFRDRINSDLTTETIRSEMTPRPVVAGPRPPSRGVNSRNRDHDPYIRNVR